MSAHRPPLGAVVLAALLALAVLATTASSRTPSARAHAPNCVATVATSTGPVCGTGAHGGREYLGIPYAASPTGDRRFAVPQPHPDWRTPFAATEPGPHCVSPALLPGQGTGAEDCLWLSLYLPPGASASSRLPVMVWIHGGAFQFDDDSGNGIGTGTGSGQELADREHVIVARVSYRLGALGFLAAGSSPGNLGLLDQRVALRWIRRNVGAFGGDPANVTLFGQSAGATSVCLQLISPGSRGLFARAIIQSGFYQHFFSAASCSQNLPDRAQAQATALALASRVGCAHAPLIPCLRRTPAATILQASSGLSFTPIVDGRTVPSQPTRAFAQGRFTHVPVIAGAARNEGLPTRVASWSAFDAMVRANDGAAASRVLAAYPQSSYPSPTVAGGAVVSDQMVCSALRTASQLARWVPTYAYRYDDVTEPFYSTTPNQLAGAYHSSELPALFPGWALPPAQLLDTPDQEAMIDTMMRYWGGFATTGHPSADGVIPWPGFRDAGSVMSLRPAYDSEVLGAAQLRGTHHCSVWDTVSP